MEHYGIRGIAVNWFASYLTNRKQSVSVNGYVSDYFEISFGYVLGALLFLIYRYINDLPNVSKFLSFYLFGDDTNIYFDASDTIKLQKIMNRELQHVKKWLEENILALHIEKTNYVIFHSLVRKITERIIIKFGANIFLDQIM